MSTQIMNRWFPTSMSLISVQVIIVQSSAHGHANFLKKLAKGHATVQYRSFKHFNQDDFLRDLSSAPSAAVLEVSDPTTALVAWYEAFLPVIQKHAPLRRKRVKHPTLPQWLSPDIITAMKTRDKLKKKRSLKITKDKEIR